MPEKSVGATMSYFTTLKDKLKDVWSDNYNTIANTSVVAVTLALEAIVNAVSFYCPCVTLTELAACKPTACKVMPRNFYYGVSFLAGPAVLLFLVGFVTNAKLWKLWTGCCYEKSSNGYIFVRSELIGIIWQALISPAAWVSFGLLQGKYYACAMTAEPYGFNTTTKNCHTISQAGTGKYGTDFVNNQSQSQTLGWFVIAVFAFVGICGYSCRKCTSHLTYYQARYHKLFNANEEREFKAQFIGMSKAAAKYNVTAFVKENRSKEDWDKISSVYDVESQGKVHHSHLQKWVKDDPDIKPWEYKEEENYPEGNYDKNNKSNGDDGGTDKNNGDREGEGEGTTDKAVGDEETIPLIEINCNRDVTIRNNSEENESRA